MTATPAYGLFGYPFWPQLYNLIQGIKTCGDVIWLTKFYDCYWNGKKHYHCIDQSNKYISIDEGMVKNNVNK